MMPIKKVVDELRECGLDPQVVTADEFAANGSGSVIKIASYRVATGRFKGRCLDIAIGFQESAYPEYPPHFIYVTELTDPKFPVHGSPFQHNGAQWYAFSVPPSDFWDNLQPAEKNMKTYVNRHLTRFWSQI